MTTDFRVQMASMRDEDLIRIVRYGDEDGYELSAIEAAQVELGKRNLDVGDISQIVADDSILRAVDESKHLVSLGWGGRIIFAVSAPSIVTMIGAVVLGGKRVFAEIPRSVAIYCCGLWPVDRGADDGIRAGRYLCLTVLRAAIIADRLDPKTIW